MAEPISGAEPSSPPGPAMTPFPALHPRAQPQAQPHSQGHSGSLYCPRGRPPEPWQLEVGVCCPQAGGRGSGLLWHRRLHALGQVCAGGDRPGPLLSPGCRVGLVLVEHPSLLTACHKQEQTLLTETLRRKGRQEREEQVSRVALLYPRWCHACWHSDCG